MRIRIAWMIVILALAGFAISCTDGGEDDEIFFGGSDPILENLYIGTVPVKEGATVNVPLANTNTIRFELSKPVPSTVLETTIDFMIRVENLDRGTTIILTDGILEENGHFVWLDSSNKYIEYRMNHNMTYVLSGGTMYNLGQVGDLFRINIEFITGKSGDGKSFAFWGDEFFVVWTRSSTK